MQKLLFVALVTLFSSLTFAEIREIQNMDQIVPVIDLKTLVVFDLDNTIMEPKQTLGSDQWYSYVVKKNVAAGMDENTAIDRAAVDFVKVQMMTQVLPTEMQTPRLLQFLQRKGIRVMGLTARPPVLASHTFAQLRSIGVNMVASPPFGQNLKLTQFPGGYYVRGIIFVGPHGNKGKGLTAFLDQIRRSPPKIVFVDDKIGNIQKVESALEQRSSQHFSFRYGYDDEKVRRFDPKIADAQWDFFEKYHKLLRDDEVRP